MAIKKILVPVDFSEHSDRAVEYAMVIANKFRAHVTIVHMIQLITENIIENDFLNTGEKILLWKENERTIQLKKLCKIGKKKGIHMDFNLFRGSSAADTIIDLANEKDFDLVIMGSHGHTGLKRWFLGSVAEKVVHLSPIPVLTIHKDFTKKKIRKILVPVDFSEYSKIAIDHGIAIAKEFKARIEFVHVVEMTSHPEFYTINAEPILKSNPTLKYYITENLIKATRKPRGYANYSVLEGKAHLEIKKFAENNHIDLIIMPTHGMGKLEHFMIGSNTEKVVRSAPCPVLTLRKDREKNKVEGVRNVS